MPEVTENQERSGSLLFDPTLYNELSPGMKLIYANSGVVGSALVIAMLFALADPGLLIYGHSEATPVGWLWSALTGSEGEFGTDLLRYAFVSLTALAILVLWPVLCVLGMIAGFVLYFLGYYLAYALYLCPFQVIHTALISLPEKWAYEHIPERLLRPVYLRRDRHDQVETYFVISFIMTALVFQICIIL